MPLSAFIRTHFKAFSLHSLTGVLSVMAHYGVMYALITQGVSALFATFIGFFFGAAIKFYFSHTTIFPNNRSHRDALIRFSFALILQAGLNVILFKIFSHLPYPTSLTNIIDATWFAQILSTGVQTVINYLVYRYWVFADKKNF